MKKLPFLASLLGASTLCAQSPMPPPPPLQPAPAIHRSIVPVNAAGLRAPEPASEESFAENYLVTLSVVENEKSLADLVVATARAKFMASNFEPTVVLDGLLTPQADGSVLFTYALTAEIAIPVSDGRPPNAGISPGNVQYRSQNAQAQVRLQPGEPLNILKSGNRTYRLTVAKLPAPAAKAP